MRRRTEVHARALRADLPEKAFKAEGLGFRVTVYDLLELR